MRRPSSPGFLLAAAVVAALLAPAAAQPVPSVERVVILKVDGLPQHLLDQYLTPDPEGSSRQQLPWFDHVFARNGTWIENFYSRGLSLSATGWSILDTGRHAPIRGNVEYDRYTLRPYDYLNFFPFYIGYATNGRVDMPGVELLDELGIPLLLDRFPYPQQFQGFQLLQRGVRWSTLQSTFNRTLAAAASRDFIDEWQLGFSVSDSFNEQIEEELRQRLQDPAIRYLDLFTGEFDHTAHLARDPVSQFHAIEKLDDLIGRVWTAIESTPLASRTALILVSDHGMNTSPDIYSQGYNFVEWFGSRAGGRHHVLTNRHPLTEFKLKGLDPFVNSVITPSPDPGYLKGAADRYPTVMLDLDGNERASIGLRNNTFNQLHILLDQLLNHQLPGTLRNAVLDALFEVLDSVRGPWQADIDALTAELAALDERIAAAQQDLETQPRKWTDEQIALGLDKQARRRAHEVKVWQDEREEYAHYAATIQRLLTLSPADFDPGSFKIEELIPARSLGPANSLYDLRHYVTGLSSDGLVMTEDRRLDWERSFTVIDYPPALTGLRVRNNVQPEVAPRPVDFAAIPLPPDSLPPELGSVSGAIWLWRDEEHQALVLARAAATASERQFRYLPVAHLQQDRSGKVTFEDCQPAPGFPLELLEDPDLALPAGAAAGWLTGWHNEREWLQAVHRTRYSNGIISLAEHFTADPALASSGALRSFQRRQRRLRAADMVVFANDHWNFNARGFNPGGNHGAFFRNSTHAVLLISGGEETGIPRGLRVTAPYDALSFVPTVLRLLGRPEPDLPGPVIEELFPPIE